MGSGHSNCKGTSGWVPLPSSGQPPCTMQDGWQLNIFGNMFDSSTFLFLFSIYKIEFYVLQKNVILVGNNFTSSSIPGYELIPPLGTLYDCKSTGSDYCVAPSNYFYGCLQSTNQSTKSDCENQDSHVLLWETITHQATRDCQGCTLGSCDNVGKCNSSVTGFCFKPDFPNTCSILSVHGNVQDSSNSNNPWYQGDNNTYCRYQRANQWRSKANSSESNEQRVDVLCHYTFDILPKGITYSADPAVKNWETDLFFKTNPNSGVGFQSDLQFRQMIQFYLYIFWWIDLYYAILYILPSQQQIYPYAQNDLYINSIMNYIPNDFDKTQKTDDLRYFLRHLLVQPTPRYDPATKTYRVQISIGYRLFEKAVLNRKKSAIDSQISRYMSRFLQEDTISIYKKGTLQPQIFSLYTIVPDTIHCLQMVPEARIYKTDSIQNSENPLPPPFDGFNDWYKTAKPDDVYNPSSSTLPFQQNIYNIPFVTCIKFELVIQKWSAPLVAIMKPVIYASIDFCNYLFENTNVYPISCSQNPTDITSYKQFVDNACNTQINTPSVAIQSILSANLAYQDSLSTTCSCYYSGLMPPNLLTFANPAAMCFDRHCTDSDRKLVNATQQYCKDNCGTVYNWIYSKDQTISQNPGALDTARFQQLCSSRNVAINWNVLGNGIGIVVLITVVLIIWKRYWGCLYISVPILAIVIFLAYDLKLRSLCDATNQSFVCETAITKIPMPTSYCDYMSCECIFNEQCPYTCTCASGKCVPQIKGYSNMTTTRKETVQWNVMGTIFILVLFIFCVFISQKIESVVGYGIWLVSSLIIMIVAIYFLMIRVYKYSVYDGSCVIPAALYCGSQSSTTRTITLDAPVDVPRYNVLLASVVSGDGNPQFITGNVLEPTNPNISFNISNISASEGYRQTSMYYAVASLGNMMSLAPYGAVGSSKVEWSSSPKKSLTIEFDRPFKSVPVVIGTPYYLTDSEHQIQFVAFQLLQVTQDFFECRLVDEKGDPQVMTAYFSWVAIGETSSPEEQFFEVHQTRTITSRFTTTTLTKSPAVGCIANSYTSTFVAIPLIYSVTNTGIEFSCAFRDEMSASPGWNYDLNDGMFSQNISFVYFIC